MTTGDILYTMKRSRTYLIVIFIIIGLGVFFKQNTYHTKPYGWSGYVPGNPIGEGTSFFIVDPDHCIGVGYSLKNIKRSEPDSRCLGVVISGQQKSSFWYYFSF
jgi:hypothetical protein